MTETTPPPPLEPLAPETVLSHAAVAVRSRSHSPEVRLRADGEWMGLLADWLAFEAESLAAGQTQIGEPGTDHALAVASAYLGPVWRRRDA